MKQKELSIVIVNYNGESYLEDCINSIYKYCSSIDFEIVIVDNKSTDNSVALLKNQYPEINLIESKDNLGFAGGNNLAVKKSLGENILLLNNDTILLQDISPAVKELKKKKTGIVGIKMLNAKKEYLTSVGKFPNALSLLKFSWLEDKRQEFLIGDFSKERYLVDWVTGAFLLTTKKIWNQVKGLDEDYFMYVEDVDFCKKVSKLNYSVVFLPTLSYIHFVGFNKTREIKLIKGYNLYSSKHFNFVNSILAKICLKINYVYKKRVKNIC
ncbi:glycosyltransferase family 2 protein [Polaribacter sp. MSW13]|uniref:Glycosyltransferase family 2 protein n=1 Tax=Polaribacter marinus TaxID=2916838 RepID=A0A9X1VLD1_9FLAO|nr:glycosyltransferase family 2 protein [Polaribacter marinus]MCI2228619.1 glycosyltransferase family 2 protein [Polaribacter marinus]